MTLLVIMLAVLCSLEVTAQELQTTRLELKGPAWNGTSGAFIGSRETLPLVLGTTAPIAQPIRFLVGPFGSTRAAEISGAGESWLQGPVAIGISTGTIPGTQLRVSDIQAENGRGIQVDLRGTTASSGIEISSIGLSGSDHAGLVLTSSANGFGTGIRIGGPAESGRPTVLTGVDITGGTGVRYNALSSGQGTALEVGGTTPPSRGVDVRVSGGEQVGVIARANTLGSGLVGMSASGSYDDVAIPRNTGVLGWAASNANASADTVTGGHGMAIRGGSGSRAMLTVGVRASSVSAASNHAGTVIGVMADAKATAPGVAVPIAGLFRTQEGGFSLASIGGDVFLGSSSAWVPEPLAATPVYSETRSTTHAYGVRTSGPRMRVGIQNVTLAAGATAVVDPFDAEVVRIESAAAGSEVDGLSGVVAGRTITIVNTNGVLLLHDNGPAAPEAQRFLLPDNDDLVVPVNGAVEVWYDDASERWRLTGRTW